MIQFVSSQRIEEACPMSRHVTRDKCSYGPEIEGTDLHRDGIGPVDHEQERAEADDHSIDDLLRHGHRKLLDSACPKGDQD
jgi:hypothetical protein